MTESQIDAVVIPTQTRLISDDFNNSTRLMSRALIEGLAALMEGDNYQALVGGIGGVIGGFQVTAINGGNTIQITGGIALVAATPASATFDPPAIWIELKTTQIIDLDPLVDGGNPRLVTIELEAAQITKVTENRDFFDPNTGTFFVQATPIVEGSEPTILATAGTASPTPQVPIGTIGRIPIAVIKLGTGQASFSDNFIPVLMCRPLLAALGGNLIAKGLAVGGGFSVGNVVGSSIASTDVADLQDSKIEMLGLPARGRGQSEFGGSNVRTLDGTTVGDLLTNINPIYAYAVPPPWAPDYGSIAPREAVVRNPNDANLFLSADSVVLGDGLTFVSLAYANPSLPGPGMENMIVIFDLTEPVGLSTGPNSAGSPRVDDLRAPHPTTAGGAQLTLLASQDVSWGNAQRVDDSVYLGTVSSLGAVGDLMGQSYRGSGFVRIIDEVDVSGMSLRPVQILNASGGILDALYPGRYPDMLVGDAEMLPPFATRVEVSSEMVVGAAGPGQARLLVASSYGFGAPEPPNGLPGFYQTRYDTSDLPQSAFGNEAVEIERDNTGAARVYFQDGGGTAVATMILAAYEDQILASR